MSALTVQIEQLLHEQDEDGRDLMAMLAASNAALKVGDSDDAERYGLAADVLMGRIRERSRALADLTCGATRSAGG